MICPKQIRVDIRKAACEAYPKSSTKIVSNVLCGSLAASPLVAMIAESPQVGATRLRRDILLLWVDACAIEW